MADLVAPIIPNAQENKGPALFLEGLNQGLANYARFAAMKRETEMDTLKLAEHERLSQEQHEIEREKMASDADYRSQMLGIHRDLADAKIELDTQAAQAWKNGTKRGWQNTIAFNQQREQILNDVNDSAKEFKLNDPLFATKEPVQYSANVQQFADEWRQSPMPEVQKAIKNFQSQADRIKVPLRIGATNVDGIWKGGKTVEKPVWQVVEKLNDPDQKDAMIETLKASGHITDLHYQKPGDPKTMTPWQKAWNWLGVTNYAPTPEDVTEPKFSPKIENAVEEGKSVEFKRVPSRVPAVMLPKGAARGTSGPTQMPQYEPDPDLPASDEDGGGPETTTGMGGSGGSPLTFEQSPTDKLISQAKAAIAQGAPIGRVMAKLQELGISPDAMMG